MQPTAETILTNMQEKMVEHALKVCDETVEKIFIYTSYDNGFMFFKFFGIRHSDYRGLSSSSLVYEIPKKFLKNFTYDGIDLMDKLYKQLKENNYPHPEVIKICYTISDKTFNTELEYERNSDKKGYLALDLAYEWKDLIEKESLYS